MSEANNTGTNTANAPLVEMFTRLRASIAEEIKTAIAQASQELRHEIDGLRSEVQQLRSPDVE